MNLEHRARRVLLLTGDPLGARLAGSAIRFLELARVLSAAGHVPTLATPVLLPDAAPQPFAVRQFDAHDGRAALRPLLEEADVLVLPFHGLCQMPFLARLRVPLVFDLYDPVVLELLDTNHDEPLGVKRRRVDVQTAIFNQVLKRGDFFLCASERQRDLLLGALLANRRIVPTPAGDPCFRWLVDVVPFGLPSAPCMRDGGTAALKGVHPGIAPDDRVLLWGGAIWPWLDPDTLIRAVAFLAGVRPDVHLVFLGVEHPTPGQVRSGVAQAHGLARDLGVMDRHVHFLGGWVPYQERARFLLEADGGVTTHRRHLESRFAFRTRVLDYLWAGVPIVCTAGDVLAELVERERLGVVVPERDVSALTAAIELVLYDHDFNTACRSRIAAVRPHHTWEAVSAPLLRFCESPRLSAGRIQALATAPAEARHLGPRMWSVLGAEAAGEALGWLRRRLGL